MTQSSSVIEIDDDDDDTESVNANKISITGLVEQQPIVYYPNKTTPGAASLVASDLARLRRYDGFLNDSLMQFYISYAPMPANAIAHCHSSSSYLLHERCDDQRRHRVHIFDTFFYDLMVQSAGDGYQRVLGRTKKVQLFDKELIFIPVTEQYVRTRALSLSPLTCLRTHREHWFLIIVAFLPQAIASGGERRCQLFCLDSLREQLPVSKYFGEVSKYLTHLVALTTVNRREMLLFDNHMPMVPMQPNCSDCGLFVLHFIEYMLYKPLPMPPASSSSPSTSYHHALEQYFVHWCASVTPAMVCCTRQLFLELIQGRMKS